MKDFIKKLMDRLSVCLTYAGEDLDDFLWVLDEDEKEGRAPANVEKMRDLYRQIKDQYAQDSETLRRGMDTADALDLAIHMVELYQSMFDYLMSGDGTEPPDAEHERSPREADFSTVYELFKNKNNKDLPS